MDLEYVLQGSVPISMMGSRKHHVQGCTSRLRDDNPSHFLVISNLGGDNTDYISSFLRCFVSLLRFSHNLTQSSPRLGFA